jgi:hypothetical protein
MHTRVGVTLTTEATRLLVLLGCLGLFVQARAADSSDVFNAQERARIMRIETVSGWLNTRFSPAELQALGDQDLRIESHRCGCDDRPPHFPYVVVLFATPKGDLVARPEGHEGHLDVAPLAVRYGNVYCAVESEQECYGAFEHLCEFTDFRYGPTLAEFFPTCKPQ